MMTINGSRLLVGLFVLLAIAGGAYAVGAQREDDPGLAAVTPIVPPLPPNDLTGVPVGGELPKVSLEEAARARAALTQDEVFQSIAAETSWTVAQEVPNMSDGGEKIGVALIIQLDEATVSKGPWRQFRCQGTVIYEYTQTYRNVTLLGATFNGDGSELLALQPLGPSSDQPLQFDDDAEAPPLKCPPGTEEENN